MSKLKYLNAATGVLKCSVLYPIDSKNSVWKKVLYFFWSVLFISSLVLTVIQCVVELIVRPFDLIEEGIIVMNTVVYISLFMNYIVLFYHAKNLVALVTNTNENFLEETDNGIEYLNMELCQKLTEKIPLFWTASLVMSTQFFSMQPLVFGLRTLPVPGWFPYDYSKSPLYEISYAWQLICQFNLGFIYGATDTIYPAMTLTIGHQFKILASNLKNSFYHSLRRCGVDGRTVEDFREELKNEDFCSVMGRHEEVFSLTKSKAFHRINNDYFKKNIRHHQLLLGYCDDLNRIMNLFLLSKVIAATFNVTFIAFGLITSGDYSRGLGLSSYVFFASTELFVYTYAGQILTENADFLWTLYEAPWYLCDLEFCQNFLFVHKRVGQMIYTKAGNYFFMCAPMAVTFLRSIFSYVALLKELVSSEKTE